MRAQLLPLLAVAGLGVYLGAMLTEGCVMLPHWRALSPQEFLAWYAANDRRLIGFFGPLTVTTAVLAVAAAVVAVRRRGPARGPAVLAALLVVAAVVMFPLFFQGVNAAFAAGSIPVEDVPAVLASWAFWHWVRTVLAAVALWAALLASRRAVL